MSAYETLNKLSQEAGTWKLIDIYIQPRQDLALCRYSFVCYSEKCFTQIYRALYGDAMLVTEERPWSNRNICHWVLLSKQKFITQGLRYIEINISSTTKTVYLAKTWAITHLLAYSRALLGCLFNVTQRANLEIQRALLHNIWGTLSASTLQKRQATRESYVWWN